jgi:hypothetical protein
LKDGKENTPNHPFGEKTIPDRRNVTCPMMLKIRVPA